MESIICLEWKTYQVTQCYIIYVLLKIYNLMQQCISFLLVVCGLWVRFGIMTIIICKLQ